MSESRLSPVEESVLRALFPNKPKWATELRHVGAASVSHVVAILAGLERRGLARLGLGGWTRTEAGTAALADTRSGVAV